MLLGLVLLAGCQKQASKIDQRLHVKDPSTEKPLPGPEQAEYERYKAEVLKKDEAILRKRGFSDAELKFIFDKHGDGRGLLCVVVTSNGYSLDTFPELHEKWQQCAAPALERDREQKKILELQREYSK